MPSDIRIFLQALFGGKPEELWLSLWTLPEKRSHWFRDIEAAIKRAESLQQQDLYVGVGLSRKDYGATHRCPSSEVAGIVGLWADFDLRSDAHPRVSLPATVEDALKILPEQWPPTFIIRTGNGLHAWWLSREPLIFDTDEQRREGANLALRWQSLLRANAAQHGWVFERLADLARLLRIPGTRNCKDAANPKPVSIYQQTDRRYNPSDLAEYLEDLGIPDPEEQERSARAWKENFTDKPLVINPNAAVPEDLLAHHRAADPRFDRTWLRQRGDLIDQSQSGYDMALANFGCSVGLSEQQVVDLIIHHRRIHGQSPRNRLDYFQRTIAKASKRTERSESNWQEKPETQFDSGHANTGSPPPKPKSPTAKALLCEQISKVLGVRILRIVKITGKEPSYQVDLESTKIEFSNVSKLVNQRSFGMAIAAAVDRLIPKIKPKLWEQIAQMMLDALTIEDGGEETDFVGSARIYIENYLSETPLIDSAEEEPIQTRRKPTVIDGKIAICADDLQQHINKTRNENLSVKAVASMLAALGATSTRIRGGRLRDQSRWLLPLAEFTPDDFGTGTGDL